MPFSTIKRQIDDNYIDIQTKTTQAVIKRLGLGTGVILTEPRGMQTVDEYVHKDVYNALDSKCFDAEQAIITLEKECEKLVKCIHARDNNIEVE